MKPGDVGAPLELWQSQRRILDEISRAMDAGIRNFYVLKSRQLGSTTVFVVILIFWLAMHPKIKAALVVDQEQTREDFRETIRFIINSIPKSYFGGHFGIKLKGGDNRHMMVFTNDSVLRFLVAGVSESKQNWGESAGYSTVVLSEVGKYGSAEGLSNFEEAMSEHNTDRLYVWESTGNGRNHWYDRWLKALADPHTCCCIFVGWWSKELNAIPRSDARFAVFTRDAPDEREREKIRLVRERFGHEISKEQLAWIRWRSSDTSKTQASLDQNQPWLPEEAFIVAGRSYFQNRLVANNMDRLSHVAYKGYRFYLGKDFWSASIEWLDSQYHKSSETELRIWADPMPEGRYVIGCDPAGGSDEKNDRHVITVWRCYADKLIQVAEYADNMVETRHCAWVLAYLAGVYRNCQIILELNGGYGKAVMTEIDHLRDQLRSDYNAEKRGPPNKANPKGQDWTDFLSMARYYIYRRPDSPASAGYILNWITHEDNKRTIFSEFRDSHINDQVVINSMPMLQEMLDVVEDKGHIGAPGGAKDDRIFAACLANHAWVQDERPSLLMQGLTYERVTEGEQGHRQHTHIVDNIVAEFFRNHKDGVQEVPQQQQWMQDLGLV